MAQEFTPEELGLVPTQREFSPEELGIGVAEKPQKSGLGAAFQRGAEQFGSSIQTAAESVTKGGEEAARGAQARQANIQRRLGEGASLERLQKVYAEKGILPAAKELAGMVPTAIVEQVPNIGATLAGAGAGALAGSAVFPGVGTVIGGALGAFAPSYIQQYGGNIQSQAEAQASQGKPLDINLGAAAGTAVPMAALDVLGTFIPLGGNMVSKILGPSAGKLLATGGTKAVEEGLLATVLKGTATGAAAEIPTEVTQQILERAQAGLPLTDEGAFNAYGATAFAVSLLGPIGIIGRVANKAQAGRDLAETQKLAAETNQPQEVNIPVTDSEEPQTFYVAPTGEVANNLDSLKEAAQFKQYYEQQVANKQEEDRIAAIPAEPVRSPEQNVAYVDPDKGLQYYTGVPNKTGSGIKLFDDAGAFVKEVKSNNKSIAINPTETEVQNLKTKEYQYDVNRLGKELDLAKTQFVQDSASFTRFLKAHPLKSTLYGEIIARVPNKNIALTKEKAKGFFINSQEKGYALDDLARIAAEAGLMTEEELNDPTDNGGVNALIDKIKQAYDPKEYGPVSTPLSADSESKYNSILDAYTRADQRLQDHVEAVQQQKIATPTEEQITATQPEFVAPAPATPITPVQAEQLEPVTPSTNVSPEGDLRFEVPYEFSVKARQDMSKIIPRLAKTLDKMGLHKININLSKNLKAMIDGKITKVNGTYLNRIISLCLDNPNIEATLHHEAIHALKEMGLFSPKEWAVLSKRANEQWIDQYNIKTRYPNASPEVQIEEAIASAFPSYMKQIGQPRGLLQRIKDFVQKVGNVFRGLGFNTSESVFGKAAEGRLTGEGAEITGKSKAEIEKSQKVSSAEMDQVHNAQRYGAGLDVVPEDMFNSQKNPGIDHNNIYQHAAEHIGDLVHRLSSIASNQGGGHVYGLEAALTKSLRNYLLNDALDQAGRNYQYHVDNYGYKGTKTDFEYDLIKAGKRYADAYSKIPVYTEFQKLARDAAVALGNFKMHRAEQLLKELSKKLQQPNAELDYFNKLPELRAEIPTKEKLKAPMAGVDPDYAEKLLNQFSAKKETVAERFKGLRANFSERLITGLFDEFRAIKKYSDDAYMMARISKSIDGGLQGLLEYGQVFNDGGALNIRPGTKGLLEILAPIGKEVDQYQIWKALNRDAALPFEKRSFTPELLAGKDQLAQGTLDGKSRKTLYETALKEENELNKSVLKVALDAGVIDKYAFKRFSDDMYYIPFYKIMEDGDVASVSKSSKLTGQYFSKELKGGMKKTNDLMENVLLNWSHILSAAMKNQAAVKTIDAAEKMGAASLAQKINGKYPSNTVKVMKDGQEVHYEISDAGLVDAISTISYLGPKSAFLDVAKGFTNALRYGVTLSPAYKVRNLIRDSIQSAAISPVGMNVFQNVIGGLAMSKEGHPTFMAALAGGGIFEMGTAHEGNQSKLIKRLIDKGVAETSILDTTGKIKGKLQDALNYYNEIGNKFENANRLSLYNKLRVEKKSHLEASYQARDLMDFSMQGQFRAIKLVASVVPFFNARLQGLYKLGRDGITPTYRVICNATTGAELQIGDKQKAMRFATISSAVMLASMALYGMYKDDEDFKRREEWDRDNFWWFKIGDTAYRIPKPFEIGALGTLAERTYEQIADDTVEGKVFFQRLNSILANNLSMNPMPQVFKPLIDLYANKDSFTGAPIESAGMENLSKQERVTNRTSGIAIALGGVSSAASKVLTFNPDAEGISPIQIDYAIKSYLGWAGATAVATADLAVEPFTEGTKVRPPIIDTVAMGFIKTEPETRSKYMTEFYQTNARVQSAMADMRHYASLGESEKVQKIIEEKGDDIALAKVYDKTSKEFAKIRQAIRTIEQMKDISPEDKRAEMNRLRILMSDLAAQMESMKKSLK